MAAALFSQNCLQSYQEQAIDNIDLRFLGAQIAQVAETAATNLEIMLTAIKAR
jgi:hypothetical protein